MATAQDRCSSIFLHCSGRKSETNAHIRIALRRWLGLVKRLRPLGPGRGCIQNGIDASSPVERGCCAGDQVLCRA